jgi:hypothetical protein
MTTMAVVVGVLGIKRGTIPRLGEDLSSNSKMSKESNYDKDDGSGGGVRDKRGDNGWTLTSSGGSLTLALGDGNISRGAVAMDGVNGSTALGGSITISSGVGMATSLGSVVVLTSNAGTAGVLDDLLLNTETASVGNSGALDIGSGLSASSSGGSIAISVGSGPNIRGLFGVMAGNLSGAAGGDVSI